MDTIVIAVIATGAIGLFAATILTIASKVMYVQVDPTVEKLKNALPGANCGACGFSGCEGYAKALAGENVKADLCPPGGEQTYKDICEILGTAAGDGPVSKTAVIRCIGGEGAVTDKLSYEGIKTCFAASAQYGGQGACSYGCLGFGDCAGVCPAAAICIVKGLARVDVRKCGGCGLCADACPQRIISVMTEPVNALVACSNTEKGAVTRKKCTKGCIACGKCVRECPEQAIALTDNLAVIDNEKCNGCGHCANICMTGCIV